MVAKDPDLVIIQFTGNDSRLFRPPLVLQQNMETLARGVLERTEALPILVANPVNDRTPGNRYVAAVREAGRRTGVPVADFDAALFAADRDYRGPFVFEGHPMDFSHSACAKTLL